MEKIPIEKLVFLDECGVNTNLVRRYGRSVGKTRVVDNAPFSTPVNTTILSAIRLDGQFACTVYDGGTIKERFLGYLENMLLSEIHAGDYVVMGNLRTHHCKGVEDMIRSKEQFALVNKNWTRNFKFYTDQKPYKFPTLFDLTDCIRFSAIVKPANAPLARLRA